MRDSFANVSPGLGSLPQGRVPTTTEWNEWQARLDKRPIRFVSAGVPKKGRTLKQFPDVSPDQARACGARLFAVLRRLCVTVSERGLLEDLVVAHAWAGAMTAIEDASKHEAVAASEPADGSDPQRESATTAVEGHHSPADSTGRPT